MSNAVYPTLPGLAFGVSKAPIWSTMTKKAVSGREFRAGYYSYPLWRFVLVYEMLRSGGGYSELQQLIGFFNARGGNFDSFLFSDPDDNSVTDQAFGIGDGQTVSFQLARTFGGFTEPLYDINGVPTIKNGGAVVSNYTISSTGVVTFNTAPIPAAVLTWSGNFYYRVRFAQETSEFTKFMRDLWENRKVELVSVKP